MARVIVIVYPGVGALDATGPAEVFAAANGAGASRYEVVLASPGGGVVRTSSGLALGTRDLLRLAPRRSDTVVVAGGDEPATLRAMAEPRLLAWLQRTRARVRRMASVCSGAFILACAGLLDGKRATTHWEGCQRLATLFPLVNVDPNAIFVQQGSLWTSAGVSTGIDMALAVVEEDHGRALADAIAARLVLYVRRPGFQSQFSEALVAQGEAAAPLGPALAWVRGNLGRASVPALARRAGLSVRTLHRRCLEHLASTPARIIDKLRVEHARTLLATTRLPAKTLAAQSGFGTAARMNRAFSRELGLLPSAYRILNQH